MNNETKKLPVENQARNSADPEEIARLFKRHPDYERLQKEKENLKKNQEK